MNATLGMKRIGSGMVSSARSVSIASEDTTDLGSETLPLAQHFRDDLKYSEGYDKGPQKVGGK